ncbi:tape measure protein [Nocardia grenadensis]|uniref:tape measure protein n=1 Tax=Nocardia grenadensis TaxID=931537 RepID=UPI003D745C09
MAVELADAYVSLVIESSKIPGQVEKGLNAAQPGVDRAGKGMGSRLASGVGSVFKSAAAGVGLAAGAVIGTALSQGMSRMVAIDDAKGKLAGLGHTAEGVATIMDSALAAVKGTAFGLGDAATIAASAVAAGVAPGQELTKYLSLTADAATIAGTSLSDMGSIINKVTTSGKAYTDDLMMLSDRGIPIFQWLQDEYGKSADELTKMVKDGKVDAETYRKVIEENIGGAALQSGKTLRGAWENTKAALGRVGEAGLKPFLDMMKGGLGTATEWADKVAPKVEATAKSIATGIGELGRAFKTHGGSVEGTASNYEKFGIKAREAWDKLGGLGSRIKEAVKAFQDANNNKFSAFWEKLTGGSADAGETFRNITKEGSGLRSTLSKLADAGKSVGQSLLSLTGDTGVVAAGVIRGIGSAMSFMARHADKAGWAVAGLVAALGVGKASHVAYEWSRIANAIMLPAQIMATRAQTAALIQHNEALRANLAARGIEVAQIQTTIRGRIAETAARARETIATQAATNALGQYAAAQRLAAANSTGLAGSMYGAAASAATLGARATATATTALGGLRNAASGLLGMIGGPFTLAIAGVGAAFMGFKGSADQAERVQTALSEAVTKGAKAQTEFRDAVSQANGALSEQAATAAGSVLEANLASITKTADEGHHWWDSFRKTFADNQFLGDIPGIDLSGWIGNTEHYNQVQRAIDQNDTFKDTLKDMKLEMSDLGPIIAAGGSEYDELIRRLESTGDAGSDVVDILKSTRSELQSQADAVRNSTFGFAPLTDAIKVLADESANADDRLSAMKRALDALTGKPVELGDAVQNLNKQLRDIDGIGESWNQKDGFGGELILPDGEINTKLENGDKLRTAFKDLRDSVLQVAQAGGDLGPVWDELNGKYEELGRSTGLSKDQVAALAETIGLVPEDIQILATVQGADRATQDLTAIKLLLDNNREGAIIDTKLIGGPEVITELQNAGAKVEEVTGKPGVFEVKAPNIQDVIDKVDHLINAKIPDKTVRVTYEQATAALGPYAGLYTPVPGRADGGPGPHTGPVYGPGGPKSDSILTALSAGEHVLTADEVNKAGGHSAIFRLRQAIRSGVPFLRRAEGGPIGIENAIKAAQSVEGNKYEWGGTGPLNFDCSGFVGWLQQIAMGIIGSTKRLYTTMSLLAGSTAGLESGLGPSGTYFQVGVSDAHMAATIDGHPVESGGAHGTSGIGGGRAGALHPDLPRKFHLPNKLIEGWNGRSKSRKSEWTEMDQIELEELNLDVTQARERRDEVYADSDSSDSDRKQADLNVRKAQQKYLDKVAKRDGSNEDDPDRPAPEAPALTRMFSEEDADRIDKLSAIEDAKEARNKVYDDPDATDLDRLKADAELSRALQDANATDNSDKPTTVRGAVTKVAGELGGILFDAVKAQLPDAISGSHWWDVADEGMSLSNEFEKAQAASAASALGPTRSFTDEEVDQQLGFIPAASGVLPAWVSQMWKMFPKVGVYDSGGWLKPGEMALNMSNRPEPIFNSPEQLSKFAGNLNGPANTGGLTEQDVVRLLALRPAYTIQTSDVRGAMQEIRVDQQRQRIAFNPRR